MPAVLTAVWFPSAVRIHHLLNALYHVLHPATKMALTRLLEVLRELCQTTGSCSSRPRVYSAGSPGVSVCHRLCPVSARPAGALGKVRKASVC